MGDFFNGQFSSLHTMTVGCLFDPLIPFSVCSSSSDFSGLDFGGVTFGFTVTFSAGDFSGVFSQVSFVVLLFLSLVLLFELSLLQSVSSLV